jgi:hypothetical protein
MAVTANQICLLGNSPLEGYLRSEFRPLGYFLCGRFRQSHLGVNNIPFSERKGYRPLKFKIRSLPKPISEKETNSNKISGIIF